MNRGYGTTCRSPKTQKQAGRKDTDAELGSEISYKFRGRFPRGVVPAEAALFCCKLPFLGNLNPKLRKQKHLKCRDKGVGTSRERSKALPGQEVSDGWRPCKPGKLLKGLCN